jgi:RNA-directed DNA polymerase
VVYADDFVVLHPTREGVEKAQRIAEEFLSGRGLHLKPRKTRIAHTQLALDGRAGFDFLGFHIRHYPASTRSAGRDPGKRPSSTMLIKPSKDAVTRHHESLREIIRRHKDTPHEALLVTLNPVIRGWSMYYRTVVAKEIFASCDYRLASTLQHWAGRRHPHKNMRWVFAKYWQRGTRNRLEFSTQDGLRLLHHADIPITRHVKVRGHASPYDGNLPYWVTRLREHPMTTSRTTILLRRQRGTCARCGLLFTDRDIIEVDHVLPRSRGGPHEVTNMQALHRHCHDQKTAQDRSQPGRHPGIHDKNHAAEEPDEANVSRPVLKTSRPREGAT